MRMPALLGKIHAAFGMSIRAKSARAWARVWIALTLGFGCVQAQTTLPANPFTPPEYAPAKAVLIEWNFNNNIWSLYSQLIAECREAVEVICVVRDQNEENIMRQRLLNDGVPSEGVSYVHVPCERMWIRDHGPFAIMTEEGMASWTSTTRPTAAWTRTCPRT